MNLIKEFRYLFDLKLKLKFVGMIFVILFGAAAELFGVSMILPIVTLATDPQAVRTNRYCRLITRVTGIEETNQVLLVLIVAMIAVYLIKNIYLAWMTYAMNSFSKNTRLHFSTKLMEAYMKQPYAYFLHKNTAEILRSVNSDTSNMYTVIINVLQLVSQGITSVALVLFLAVSNIEMTMIVAALLAFCAGLVILLIQKKMRSLGDTYHDINADIIKCSKQAFEGIKEVKIMNKERYFIGEYSHIYHRATKLELTYNLLSYIPKYLIETIAIGGILGYLAVVILLGGSLSAMIPQLSVFAVAAFRLLPSVNSLYASFSNIAYNMASIDLIYHDIRSVEHVDDSNIGAEECGQLQFEHAIEVKELSFTYEESDKIILDHVNVTIHKGESVAFIGESGGGKTTLVDNILGILTPQRGSVLVDGVNINEVMQSWHRDIGYIPQTIFMMDDTVRCNVAFGVKNEDIDDERVWEALREAQLEEFVKQMEHGLDTEVGEAGMRLSGGQRQRIGIARALYHDPDILVFDEATSALDNETEKEVMAAIDALHGSKTMIMIAHRLTTIENCDHVYRVEDRNIQKVR
ncbi:MAG: ABC transporter ATP-binding protein/permease [bacterium]|nr:ABC transporter ATP-binding protein/permease [bacterium]